MRLIFVIGMHRSGTSCLTGLLENAGVTLGDVVRRSPHNLKGNNENRRVMRLNESILEDNGGAWNKPCDEPLRFSKSHRREVRAILEELLQAGKVVALKDPRCLFTYPLWAEEARTCGARIDHIGTFRRPDRVVASLRARDEKLDEEACFERWRLSNEKALELHRQTSFPFVDFDLPGKEYLACVKRAFTELELPEPQGELFFTEQLRRQQVAGTFPQGLESLYNRLKGLCI